MQNAKEEKKEGGEAYAWCCRTRLHYSCSTVCVTFTEFVVPELLKRRITSLQIATQLDGNDQVQVKNIKVKGLNFVHWMKRCIA
jgi:hypothetical protein